MIDDPHSAVSVEALAKPPKASRLTVFFGIALLGSLIARVLILWPKTPFWYDECLTLYGSTGPHWSDFLTSVSTGINATPPIYFALLWGLSPLCGAGFPLVLRLLSAVQLAAAGTLTYHIIQPSCGRGPAALSVGTIFGTSLALLLNSGLDARFYAFFVLGAATVIATSHRLATSESPRVPLLAANTAAHALLALSCYTGIFFCGACVLALIVNDRLAGSRFRWRVALSSMAGWMTLLPLVPLLRVHLATAPTAWIGRPRLTDLRDAADPKANLVLLAGCLVMLFLVAGNPPKSLASDHAALEQPERLAVAASRRFLFLVSSFFLAIPIAFWSLAQFGPNLSLPRYALPMTLGWVLLLALAVSRLELSAEHTRRGRVALAIAVLGLLAYAPLDAFMKPAPATPRWPTSVAEFREPTVRDCPIVTADSLTYLPRRVAGFESSRFGFVCQDEREVDRWVRFNPALHPSTAADFLQGHPRFLLLNDRLDRPEWSRWLELQLRNDPAWRVSPLTAEGTSSLLLVERR